MEESDDFLDDFSIRQSDDDASIAGFQQLLRECARFLNTHYIWNGRSKFDDGLLYRTPSSSDRSIVGYNQAAFDYLPEELKEPLLQHELFPDYHFNFVGGYNTPEGLIPVVNQPAESVAPFLSSDDVANALATERAYRLFREGLQAQATSTAAASALAAVGAYIPAARRGAVVVMVTGAAAMLSSLVWWGVTSASDFVFGETDSIAKLAASGLPSVEDATANPELLKQIPRVVEVHDDVSVGPISNGRPEHLDELVKSGAAKVHFMPRNMARQIVEDRQPQIVKESRLVPASTMMLTGIGGLVGYAAFGWTGAAIGAAGIYVFSMMNNYS